MKKRVIIFTTFILWMFVYSLEVFAGGTPVNNGKPYVFVEGKYYDLWKSDKGKGWSYDGKLTLTLNGYNSTGIEFNDLDPVIVSNCRIVLKGTNSLNNSNPNVGNSLMTNNNDNLFIDGPGKLQNVYMAWGKKVVVEKAADLSLEDTYPVETYVASGAILRLTYTRGPRLTLSKNLYVAGSVYADNKTNSFDYPNIAKSGEIICTSTPGITGLWIPTVYYGEKPHNLSGYQFLLQDGSKAIVNAQMGGDVLDGNNQTAMYVKILGSKTFSIPTWKGLASGNDSENETQTDENKQITKKVGNITYLVKGSTSATVKKIDASAKTVKIPSTITVNSKKVKVTAIAAKAFYKNTALKEVTIPAYVTTIGSNAFYGCKNLKKITISSKNLTDKKIGTNAFKGIYAKAVIQVPKTKLALYKTILSKKGIGKNVVIK